MTRGTRPSRIAVPSRIWSRFTLLRQAAPPCMSWLRSVWVLLGAWLPEGEQGGQPGPLAVEAAEPGLLPRPPACCPGEGNPGCARPHGVRYKRTH